jgi:hypothetical protein
VELALDFVVLALYDVTVMCDDSASMKVRHQLWLSPLAPQFIQGPHL